MVSHCDWGIKGRFRTTQGEIAIDFISPLLEKKTCMHRGSRYP